MAEATDSTKDKAAVGTHNTIIRDPNLAKNRIFIGNLPTCTRDELESICHPYGKVLGSLVQKNFGFVQFDSEEVANKVATALTKSTFKGNTITVRNAGAKKTGGAPKNKANTEAAATTVGAGGAVNTNPDYNDCEIIVVDRKNTKYAEFIEERLKRLHLRVDVLFPNEDVPLGKVLGNISQRGCLYAVLVTAQHEEHNSITVNILYGQPAEHRNMPVEDAIKLISDDVHSKIGIRGVIAPTTTTTPVAGEGLPDAINTLIARLADNMPLTVPQYDKLIKHLQERRELQLQSQSGESSSPAVAATDPEIELQKKILNILNKPSVAEQHYELLYPTLQSVKEDYRILELLQDERVQKALDSLMESTLVGTVENYMKF